jgi:hypothetical protein
MQLDGAMREYPSILDASGRTTNSCNRAMASKGARGACRINNDQGSDDLRGTAELKAE